jgi:hypothetical protein
MNARRLIFATVAMVSALACALVTGVVPAMAAPVQFASEQAVGIPVGVAVNQASGDVYVANVLAGQVDALASSGGLLASFGFEFRPYSNDEEDPEALAVDNELSSTSYGDVYVVDYSNRRVDKFTSSGEFLLTFGGGVNEKTGGDVCLAGEACKKGTGGTANGQFEAFPSRESLIAVGPEGRVYVGDKARVQVFEPSGVWRENVSLSALSSTGSVTALTVDSIGDMFVKDDGVAGVRELEPDGTEKGFQFDAGSNSVEALALDGSGDVFVADSSGGEHVLEYDLTGKELDSVASPAGTVHGMAYASTQGDLYVSGYRELARTEYENAVWVLTPPVSGPPTIEAGSVSAAGEPRGRASLTAKFNPGDFETTYHFEYVDETDFNTGGYANASSTPNVAVGPGLEEQSPSVALTGLVAGATYHYRFVATNSKGTVTGADETFTETPAALVGGPWVTSVAATSATFGAEVNPLGVSTEYRLEYGTSASYGESVSGSVGGSEGYVAIGFHRQGLSPGMLYHYRVVTHNEFGTTESADHTFITQSASVASVLPDGRVWELVSPADKKGAVIEPFESGGTRTQAADDGGAITYLAEGPSFGEGASGKIKWTQIISRRRHEGWKSEDLTVAGNLPENGEQADEIADQLPEYQFFSADLSLAGVEPLAFEAAPLSSEATEPTLYLRGDGDRSFVPLVTSANVPPGTKIDEPLPAGVSSDGNRTEWAMHFLAATPDLSHVLFRTPVALTPAEGLTPAAIDEESVTKFHGEPKSNLYEWSEGKLRLVNVLPDGEATRDTATPYVRLAGSGGIEGYEQGGSARAMSSNGRLIAWTLGEPGGAEPFSPGEYKGLYVRDMVEEKTVQVGGPDAVFQMMNSDGSKIFYLEKGELYVFEYETGVQTDLTANHGTGESSAGVRRSVSDVSEDGSYVYFIAKGVLADGGMPGENNLYLLHDTDNGWQTTYIATLSQEDKFSWYAETGKAFTDLSRVSSRVSPNGHYFVFMSKRSLTGYDNIDAKSGESDQEVYLYDAVTNKLTCASCDPTGARPVGVFDNRAAALLVDKVGQWSEYKEGEETSSTQWLAGSIPARRPSYSVAYQPRYLSDSGRLFFDSPDALVPQATNGLEDVYEYEPLAGGETAESDDCTVASSTYSERSGGCVSLVSPGTSNAESVFYDASENGDDVFFITKAKLVSEDYDNGYDVYDAHVCSAAAPCATVPVSSPPCTSGDSCKAAPSPQPEIFGPTPSATFNGIGNVIASSSVSVVKTKSLTNAQKLVGALKVCRREKGKRRSSCEARARKRYPVKRARKAAKTTVKGGR